MTYSCDICETPLPPGYTPQVDGRGRPCLAICESCEDQLVAERAARREALGYSDNEADCAGDCGYHSHGWEV
jgi:hypothetical protein